jgi:hypothetical protein
MLLTTSSHTANLPHRSPEAWVHDTEGSAHPRAVVWLRSATEPMRSDLVQRDIAVGRKWLTTAGVPARSITVVDPCATSSSHLPMARTHLLRLAERGLVSHVWMRTVDRLGRDAAAPDVLIELLQLDVRVIVGEGYMLRNSAARDIGAVLLRWC